MRRLYADFNDLAADGTLPLTCRGSIDSIAALEEPLVNGEAVVLSDGDVEVDAQVFRDPDGVWVARGAWSFRDTPLSSLLGEDGVPYVRDRVGSAIADGRAGTGPRRCALQFNRFEVTVDLDEETVLVQNVLDATDAGEQRVSIAAFLAAVAERGASD